MNNLYAAQTEMEKAEARKILRAYLRSLLVQDKELIHKATGSTYVFKGFAFVRNGEKDEEKLVVIDPGGISELVDAADFSIEVSLDSLHVD